MASIIPVAKALYLCEETDVEGGLTNLFALFNSIRPRQYPHWQMTFTCFAQLVAGLGDVAFHLDVRRADDQGLVHRTDVRNLHFPDRHTLVQLIVHIEGCSFEHPGVYLVELYCNNHWVADTTVRLREPKS